MDARMSEFMFGVGKGLVSQRDGKRIDAVARKHECTFVWATIPGNGAQHWFAGPNRGNPFDGAMAKAVYADLDAAGIDVAECVARASTRRR
jgi:hypothetical protein